MMEIFKNKTDVEIYNMCTLEYSKDTNLHGLRNFVKSNKYGFCDDEHYVMWREIVKFLPKTFNFLEIGVYRGQILCLVALLSKRFDKNCNFLGITPLDSTGDKFSVYGDYDYSSDIINIFKTFDIPFDLNKNIINGLSTEKSVKTILTNKEKFDVIYIDGGHDYDVVVSDILLVKEIIKDGGLIITDDSSCYKNLSGLPIFKGHIDVCDAIKDFLENDKDYSEIVCVGHNRVFKKIK